MPGAANKLYIIDVTSGYGIPVPTCSSSTPSFCDPEYLHVTNFLKSFLFRVRVTSPFMDAASHLSVVIDFSPSQWHQSAHNVNPYPLSLNSFLSQLLAFLNSHIAFKHENTLAVFGAFPGKRYVVLELYPGHNLIPPDGPVSCCTPRRTYQQTIKLLMPTRTHPLN